MAKCKSINEVSDLNEFMSQIGDSLNNWFGVSGNKYDFNGLLKFYQSEYYRMMPYNDIRSKLYASIITSANPIESGDSTDISNIATMAPYDLNPKNFVSRNVSHDMIK